MVKKRIRILYVDDSRLDRELVRHALEKEHGGFEVIEAASHAEFEERLLDDYDLVLSDFNILGFEGLQVLDAMREKDPTVPVVIVTGTGSEEVAVDAMKRGAADYVIKTPQHIRRLPHTIEAALEKRRLAEQQRTAELALRRSEEQYRNMFESVADAVLVLDFNLRILDVNPAACTKYGYAREAFIGTSVRSLSLPGKDPFTPDVLAQLAEGRSYITESVETPVDGTHFDAEIRLSLFAYHGEAHILSLVRDITERRRLEREILEISGREQRRIGQDLHDELGQVLTGIGFRVAEVEQELNKENHPWYRQVVELSGMIEQAIYQTRMLAQGLNPISVGAQNLTSALNHLVMQVEQMFGVQIHFEGSQPIHLDDEEAAIQVYRIAQEALSNAIKHAGAKRITLSVERTGSLVRLSIVDNGRGLPAPKDRGKGMGLRIMEYRARMIKGALQLQPNPETGTRVVCTFSITPFITQTN